jgi:hypothetical protein
MDIINPAVQEELNQRVPVFYAEDKATKEHKNLADVQKEKIKELMLSAKLDDFEVGGIAVKCITAEKETINEDMLIPILKEKKIKKVVKKKEYVDMEALENAIYNGQLSAAEIAKCVEKTPVVTLRVSAKKK